MIRVTVLSRGKPVLSVVRELCGCYRKTPYLHLTPTENRLERSYIGHMLQLVQCTCCRAVLGHGFRSGLRLAPNRCFYFFVFLYFLIDFFSGLVRGFEGK